MIDYALLLKFDIDQETKPQLIVCSEAMPDAIRKLTKKYLTDDAVTVNISGKNAEAANGDDDDDEDDEVRFLNKEKFLNTTNDFI